MCTTPSSTDSLPWQNRETAWGSKIHSASSITRRWRVSGVSPSFTYTAFCRMMGPPSQTSLTKWTVAPVTFTPRARTASWT